MWWEVKAIRLSGSAYVTPGKGAVLDYCVVQRVSRLSGAACWLRYSFLSMWRCGSVKTEVSLYVASVESGRDAFACFVSDRVFYAAYMNIWLRLCTNDIRTRHGRLTFIVSKLRNTNIWLLLCTNNATKHEHPTSIVYKWHKHATKHKRMTSIVSKRRITNIWLLLCTNNASTLRNMNIWLPRDTNIWLSLCTSYETRPYYFHCVQTTQARYEALT